MFCAPAPIGMRVSGRTRRILQPENCQNMRRATSFLLLTAALGCDPGSDPESLVVDDASRDQSFVKAVADGAPTQDRDAGANVLASVDLPGGGTLKFIDESHLIGDPAVGIVELGSKGAVSPLKAYGHWNATPLEIFKAVAPDASVPEVILDDHASRSAADPRIGLEPRKLPGVKDLSTHLEPSKLTSSGACDTAAQFHTNFSTTFTWFTDHVHFASQIGDLTFTLPSSNERALGVCLTAGTSGRLDADIEVESTPGLWQHVTGPWGVFPNDFYFWYWSTSISNYRYRMLISSASGDTHHLEGSW